ncbi:hypothetical protein [Methylobacterium flocculans]|uniref:hypothetical protein n=1 Tax=Methylobacterium flocculans TaxID=2984843 RepID=UPI0021F28834|nr:hypothetical protein [Methylobacterium sp. FF17]
MHTTDQTAPPPRLPLEEDSAAIEEAIYSLTLAAALLNVNHAAEGRDPPAAPSLGETPMSALIRDPVNLTCLSAVSLLAERLRAVLDDGTRAEDVFGRVAERVERATAFHQSAPSHCH